MVVIHRCVNITECFWVEVPQFRQKSVEGDIKSIALALIRKERVLLGADKCLEEIERKVYYVNLLFAGLMFDFDWTVFFVKCL